MPVIPAADAEQKASAVGGRLVDLMERRQCGAGQKCPWDLVVALGLTPLDQAAAAWVLADEIMSFRAGLDQATYDLWRDATLAAQQLTGVDRTVVYHYARPVFGTANPAHHGVAGYVGEWMWYLLTRDLPAEPGRTVEFIDPPGPTVNDSGGDGMILHRIAGATPEFAFRLWEMKKYTAAANDVQPTIRGAWQQINTEGATYLGQVPWADKHLAPDAKAFVGGLVRMWVAADPRTNGGVSVALNATATPTEAFHLSHNHFTTHTHAGALQGLVVAVDDFEGFAQQVREYVWSAL
ncbi:hypothetical protein AB0N46_11500 [Streptomyces albidoflavus]|uniref:hypothetical protein n=1 Tax=Streptomyces albidoflavus TaxID=1886 RepID=UPI00343E47C1